MTLKAVEASDLVDLGHRIGWNLEAGGLHVVLQLAGLGSDFGERKGKERHCCGFDWCWCEGWYSADALYCYCQ